MTALSPQACAQPQPLCVGPRELCACRPQRRSQARQVVAHGVGRLSAGSPGEQFMERVNAVSPCHLDPETVVLGAMALFPVALFAAGKVLLWDYQNRPSIPERREVAERGSYPSGSGSAYQWQAKPASSQPRPASKRSRHAAWAAQFVSRSVWLTSAMVRWSAARDACISPMPGPSQWLWLSCLLQLQEAQAASRQAQSEAMADLAEATMRVSIPLALSEARRLSTDAQD